MHAVAADRTAARLVAAVGLCVLVAPALKAGGSFRAVGKSSPLCVVSPPAGVLRGTATRETVCAYKGIPFAQPPVGALRWMPPVPAPFWLGIREATTFGAACLQFPPMSVAYTQPPRGHVDEDCLFLNVYAPTGRPRRQLLPVLVYIHGGYHVRGAASDPSVEGSEVASNGVVVVNFNYRLSILGGATHPALRKRTA